MAEISTAAPVKTGKAAEKTKEKRPTKPRAHPTTSEMVLAAITNLAEKKGSSLAAIKKYIVGTYNLDIEKQASFIRRALKAAVEKKTIIQTKGTGASGRFRLPGKADESKVPKKPAAKKEAAAKKKPVAKAKKAAAPKKAPKPKPAKTVKSPKSPKSKKSSAKPKTSSAAKSTASKKAAKK
ncbi:hypothetical protein QAD02_018588 [Eretmocerus hayati]|uniref:Uncharacterized protein n=1 Tax=Eretmocerus hayati TaxID=131215 RepID=A0ACC2PIZ3_9HYME|nr:hypothetical protein QAD02_018588 [Eretmocerus hayati]